MLKKTLSAVALAASLSAVSASADPAGTDAASNPTSTSFAVSAFAVPVSDLAATTTPTVEAVGFAPAPPRGTTYESVRYRPRPRRYPPRDDYYESRRNRSNYGAPFQIHAGFFELDDENSPTSFVVGLRGGPMVDPHVQIAFGLDWMHNGEKSRTVTGEPYEQGGVIIVPERELARASSDILPITVNLQVNLATGGALVPYVGIGGGWQVLFLNAEDFATGDQFDATFNGWTWQLYGGAQLPLSGNARLVGEAFLHQGEVEREVDDVATGATYREIVDLDGAGMRFGLSWGF